MSPSFLRSLAGAALALILFSAGAAAPEPAMPPSSSAMHGGPAGAPSTAVDITGAVDRPISLTVEAIKTAPSVTVTAGGHSYTGAALWPLLQAAGIHGNRPKNPTVSMYIVATGSDGYQVVIALAELDPDFGARPAIVAHSIDGAPLGRSGALRLIVPSDVKMARSVANLVRVELVTIAAPAR